jgi:hypothetical protein
MKVVDEGIYEGVRHLILEVEATGLVSVVLMVVVVIRN